MAINDIFFGKKPKKRVKISDGVNKKNKLTPEQVVEAKKMYAALMTMTEIGQHFGVDISTIKRYVKS